jgi:hypothetical protein
MTIDGVVRDSDGFRAEGTEAAWGEVEDGVEAEKKDDAGVEKEAGAGRRKLTQMPTRMARRSKMTPGVREERWVARQRR